MKENLQPFSTNVPSQHFPLLLFNRGWNQVWILLRGFIRVLKTYGERKILSAWIWRIFLQLPPSPITLSVRFRLSSFRTDALADVSDGRSCVWRRWSRLTPSIDKCCFLIVSSMDESWSLMPPIGACLLNSTGSLSETQHREHTLTHIQT